MRLIITGLVAILASPAFAAPRGERDALDDRDVVACLRAGAISERDARMLAGASAAFAEHRTRHVRVERDCRDALVAIAVRDELEIAQDLAE